MSSTIVFNYITKSDFKKEAITGGIRMTLLMYHFL
jgi:hypothetical protein